MAVDANEVRSRRGLLAAALGGLGALVAESVVRPRQADAANGDTVKVGQARSGSALTSITSSASGFKGKSTGAGLSGVIGESTSGSGFGVNGINTASSGTPIGVRGAAGTGGIGVYGNGPRGVMGESLGAGGFGVVGKSSATTGAGNGVRALALAPGAEAIYAENSAAGGSGHAINAIASTDTVVKVENVSGSAVTNVGVFSKAINQGVWGVGKEGVYGETGATDSSVSAVGVKGEANAVNHFGGHFRNINNGGFALRVQGGLRLEGAGGLANIAAGQSSVTVTPSIPFRSGSFVVATLQSSAAGTLAVARVAMGVSSFTIHLTAAAPAGGVAVGWIMAN
jgi:hypothetical protein